MRHDNSTEVTHIETDERGVVTRIEFIEGCELVVATYERTGTGPRDLRTKVMVYDRRTNPGTAA